MVTESCGSIVCPVPVKRTRAGTREDKQKQAKEEKASASMLRAMRRRGNDSSAPAEIARYANILSRFSTRGLCLRWIGSSKDWRRHKGASFDFTAPMTRPRPRTGWGAEMYRSSCRRSPRRQPSSSSRTAPACGWPLHLSVSHKARINRFPSQIDLGAWSVYTKTKISRLI